MLRRMAVSRCCCVQQDRFAYCGNWAGFWENAPEPFLYGEGVFARDIGIGWDRSGVDNTRRMLAVEFFKQPRINPVTASRLSIWLLSEKTFIPITDPRPSPLTANFRINTLRSYPGVMPTTVIGYVFWSFPVPYVDGGSGFWVAQGRFDTPDLTSLVNPRIADPSFSNGQFGQDGLITFDIAANGDESSKKWTVVGTDYDPGNPLQEPYVTRFYYH